MGNSVRSTLGNMCGGEASKDTQFDEDQRPVAKPKELSEKKNEKKAEKESKKKKKKEKKKDKKNGTLTKIDEGGEEQPTPLVSNGPTDEQPNDEKLQEKSNDETSKQTDPGKSEEETEGEQSTSDEKDKKEVEEDSVSELFLKDKVATDTSVSVSDDDVSDDQEETVDVENEEPSRTVTTPVESSVENITKSADSLGNSNQVSDSDQRSGSDSQSSGMLLNNNVTDSTVPMYMTVERMTPEEIGISYADSIFKGSEETYQIFVDKNHEFKLAVEQFQGSILPEGESPKFEQCLEAYKELLKNERNLLGEEVDISDVNVSVQVVRTQSQQLIDTIDNVKPRVEKNLSEAANVDVIEYVKGKMVEGEQLGITSKFSAPGKYRRNMKQLKRALGSLDTVRNEASDILVSLDTNNEESDIQSRLSPVEDNESAIVPISKSEPENEEDMFGKLSSLDPPSDVELDFDEPPKIGGEPSSEATTPIPEPSPIDDSEEDKLKTLLEKSAGLDRSSSPETMTFVIERIPEKSNTSASVTPQRTMSDPFQKKPTSPSPTGKQSPVQQVIVEEEEHNTLDFGKYILVDPNTGDIAVMRNRSRSLDSLVSMASNRSSLSRFGSFEFVTDMEINIAEKNQKTYV